MVFLHRMHLVSLALAYNVFLYCILLFPFDHVHKVRAEDASVPYHYNLIRTDLECRKFTATFGSLAAGGICPHLSRGNVDAILPNAATRTDLQLINMMRMFPDEFAATSPYFAGRSFPRGQEHDSQCGIAQETPFWENPEGIELATWHAASLLTCQDYPSNAHWTCNDDCYLFDTGGNKYPCKPEKRRDAFLASPYKVEGTNGFSEAICNGGFLGCLTSIDHCSSLFSDMSKYVGLGHSIHPTNPGIHQVVVQHAKNTRGVNELRANWENAEYPIPSGAHLDYRPHVKNDYIVGSNDYDRVVFLATHYKIDSSRKYAETVGYVLFQGARHRMERLYGDSKRGAYELQWTDRPTTCEPYAFEFFSYDNDGEMVDYNRLPQQNHFFFGTRWTARNGRVECDENHYYFNGSDWVANATPDLPEFGKPANECQGCSKITSSITTGLDDPPPPPELVTSQTTPSPTPGLGRTDTSNTESPTTQNPIDEPTSGLPNHPSTLEPSALVSTVDSSNNAPSTLKPSISFSTVSPTPPIAKDYDEDGNKNDNDDDGGFGFLTLLLHIIGWFFNLFALN